MAESPVEQVRAGVDIVDLVSQHVSLKKAGRTFKGLCPFHNEKTPSFVVFPDTGRWHCFGCGEGGDIFTFLMKVENLTFVDALRQLADRIGVTVVQTHEAPERREANERLFAANEAAAIYYNNVLLNSPRVRAYVAERGITDDTLRSFLLGLSPDSYEAVQRHLTDQGFTRDELLAAGLLYQTEEGPVRDRYRGRLMFPIRDANGRIVSFGARALASETQPKYLNGPATEIFDKSVTLYGFHQGSDAIRKERRAVVVEGYVDVVIAHQAGFRNVVATLGTAITERHLRQLARLAGEICLALDPDAAGESAARRGAESANPLHEEQEISVRTGLRTVIRFPSSSRTSITVAVLPDGKDPDELILADPEQWKTAIAHARPAVEYAIGWISDRHDVSTAQGKSDAVEALAPLLLDIADPIQRSHYVELAAERLHVDSRLLLDRLAMQARAARRVEVRRATRPPGVVNPTASEPESLAAPTRPRQAGEQDYALALATVAAERGLPAVPLEAADFIDPSARALAERIIDLLRDDARDDWRPDLLVLAEDPWLQDSIERVRSLLDGLRRLQDAQLAAETEGIVQQLRLSRLGVEVDESAQLLDHAEPEEATRILAVIDAKNRERAALWRGSKQRPVGGALKPHRVAIVPSRFRLPPGPESARSPIPR